MVSDATHRLGVGRMPGWAALMAACLLVVPPLGGSRAADPARGGELARRWCANCHLVAPDQAVTRADGLPTFAAIATNPANTDARLRGRLTDSHGRMPDFNLSRDEADDLIAYIRTLR